MSAFFPPQIQPHTHTHFMPCLRFTSKSKFPFQSFQLKMKHIHSARLGTVTAAINKAEMFQLQMFVEKSTMKDKLVFLFAIDD